MSTRYSDWRRDAIGDRMARLARDDPEEFGKVFGARGQVALGLYLAGAEANNVDVYAEASEER